MTLTMVLRMASVVKISFGKLHALMSASILLVLMSEIAKVCGTKRGKFNNHNLQIYVTIQKDVHNIRFINKDLISNMATNIVSLNISYRYVFTLGVIIYHKNIGYRFIVFSLR